MWLELGGVRAHEQKLLLESFCNECLMQNHVRAVRGEGPLVYMEAKGVFEEVWQATLEGVEKKKDANDVYSTFARARKCVVALKEAQDDNRSLRTRIRELESNQGPFEHRGGGNGGGRGRGERGGRGGTGGLGMMMQLWQPGSWSACIVIGSNSARSSHVTSSTSAIRRLVSTGSAA